VPLESTAQVWEPPEETEVAVLMPLTETGVYWLLVEPLPNRPELPDPQHLTVPPERTAQLWEPPAETAIAVLMPLTETGVYCVLVPDDE
jgi:hypothetical protein